MAQATAGIRDHAGWQIAAAAFCGQTLASLGFLSVPLFAPSLAALNGLDERDFGFSGSFCFLAVALASPAAGHLVRRCGAVPMMTGALVMMATSFLLILFGTWTATMAASFGFGLAYGVYGAGTATVVATRTPLARRGLYMAVRQSGVSFAGVLAGRILPPLILATAWWVGVISVSAFMLAAAVLTLMFASLFTIPAGQTGAAPPEPSARRNLVARFVDGYRLPMPLQAFAFTAVGFAIAHIGLSSFAYFYLLERLGYGEVAAGAFLANVLLAAAIGRPLVGWIVDMTGSPLIVLAGIALLGAASFVALLALSADTAPWVVVLVSIVAGVSANTWSPVFMTAIANAAPEGRVGDYNGRGFSYAALGWTVAAPVVWSLIELSGGYRLPFTLLLITELAIAAFLIALAPRLEQRRATDRPPDADPSL